MNWSINDNLSVDEYSNIEVSYVDDRLLSISAWPKEERDWPGFSIWYDVLEEAAVYGAGTEIADGTLLSTSGSNLEMTVSSFTSIGDLICLNFDNGEFSGELKVRLDNIVQTGAVKGKAWKDENENGIRENNEDLLENIHLRIWLISDIDSSIRPYFYPRDSIKTNEFGEFTIEGLILDHPVKLQFVTYNDFDVSPPDEGSDDTIDSDFHIISETSFSKWYETDAFTIQGNVPKNHFGLGLKEK